jgi:uncharacterized protein YlxW (UPF0749 family)
MWVLSAYAIAGCVLLYREMESAAKRASQQQELLNSRIAELDAESRKLRDQKYQLDTQVRRDACCCGVRVVR